MFPLVKSHKSSKLTASKIGKKIQSYIKASGQFGALGGELRADPAGLSALNVSVVPLKKIIEVNGLT